HTSWTVNVKAGSPALREFENAVEADAQYRRPRPPLPVIFEEDWTPKKRQVRQQVCAEQPYNVVTLGKESETVLAILEEARVKFNVEVFRDDYETVAQYLKDNPPSADAAT